MLIDYNAEADRFELRSTGDTRFVSDWVGWKRIITGAYVAPGWASSILAVKPPRGMAVSWTKEATDRRDLVLRLFREARAILDGAPAPKALQAPTERQPRAHQAQAVAAIRGFRWRCLLADKMGLGKTSTALWAAHDCGVKRLLVVCPVSVKFNWQAELQATLGESWAGVVIDGTSKQRATQIADAMTYDLAKNTAIIINYDLLRQLTDDQRERISRWVSRGMVLLDESHYLKNRDSERSKLVRELAGSAPYVIAMTGTPIRNLAEDLFNQIETVRPGTWTSFRDFAKRHLVIQAVKFGKKQVSKTVGTKNLEELNAVLNTLQIKREKHEVIGLPPKTYTRPPMELDGPHLKLYLSMKDFARVELSKFVQQQLNGQINIFDPRAKSAVEQALRCEQLAQGFVGGLPNQLIDRAGPLLRGAKTVTGYPGTLIFPDSPKLVWLVETIESVHKEGGAPLVFTRFNAPGHWLEKHLTTELGIHTLFLHGGLSAQEKREATEAFQHGRIHCLISQVKMAEGWNAPRSQDVLFLGRDWSPAINEQAEDRAHRMGQKGTVHVQIPIVTNTIERMIERRLAAKNADAQQALRNVTLEELMEAL